MLTARRVYRLFFPFSFFFLFFFFFLIPFNLKTRVCHHRSRHWRARNSRTSAFEPEPERRVRTARGRRKLGARMRGDRNHAPFFRLRFTHLLRLTALSKEVRILRYKHPQLPSSQFLLYSTAYSNTLNPSVPDASVPSATVIDSC